MTDEELVDLPEPKDEKEKDEASPDEASPLERMQACRNEITSVLDDYGFSLVPFLLRPVPVGSGGNVLQIQAAYKLVPKPVDE